MVALHERGQRVEKDFRAVERIHVQFGFVVQAQVIGVEDDGRHVQIMAFNADALAVAERDCVSDYDGADMALAQDAQSRVSRRHWYDPVTRVSQNRIADRSQHPLCRNRKDCRTHKFLSVDLNCLISSKFKQVFSGSTGKASKSFFMKGSLPKLLIIFEKKILPRV